MSDEAKARRHLPWCRLHDTWYTTRSHLALDGVALNIGPRLMSMANASPERGVLLDATGAPLTARVLAREIRFPAAQIQRALGQLVACGTLVVRHDGAWEFPSFLRWQEDPSAERQRRRREATGGVTGPVTETVTEGVTVTRIVTPSVTLRGQRTENRDPDPPPPPVPGGADGGAEGVTVDPAPSTQLVLAPTPPPAIAEPSVADVVEAWNRGREGSPIPRLQRPHRGTEARDRQIRDAMKRHPEPSAWEWCARALASSPHHRGENDRGWIADLEFVVGRGKGATLDRWIEAGERLRTGEAQPPALRTAGRRLTPAEAMIAETRAHLAQRAQALLADVEPRETYDYEAIDITGGTP